MKNIEIATELDTPLNPLDMDKFVKRAQKLIDAGADYITVADCPLGKARLDSSMAAARLKREKNIEVIPHLACRDRNANATIALLLGLGGEGVRNVLAVTGDPLLDDGKTKPVFNFNSVGLAEFIKNLNETVFIEQPFKIHAALNVNAPNFDAELKKAEKKVQAGVTSFLTQPIFDDNALKNLKHAANSLNATFFGGIMPLTSYKNAVFVSKNVPGINIPQETVAKFESTEDIFCTSVDTAYSTAEKIGQIIDKFYIITTLNRVDIVTEIIRKLKPWGAAPHPA